MLYYLGKSAHQCFLCIVYVCKKSAHCKCCHCVRLYANRFKAVCGKLFQHLFCMYLRGKIVLLQKLNAGLELFSYEA